LHKKTKTSEKDSDEKKKESIEKRNKDMNALIGKEVSLDCDYLGITMDQFRKSHSEIKISPNHITCLELLIEPIDSKGSTKKKGQSSDT